MKRYKIAENRITAEGQGVGNMFEEPDWNRVSICTIHEKLIRLEATLCVKVRTYQVSDFFFD